MLGLKNIRKQRGDTLAQLAKYLGVAPNTVWRWEAGEAEPNIIIKRSICERYGCSFDDLLNPAQPTQKTSAHLSETAG